MDIITNIKKAKHLDTNRKNNFIIQFVKKIEFDVPDKMLIIKEVPFT